MFGSFWAELSSNEKMIAEVFTDLKAKMKSDQNHILVDQNVEGLENGSCLLRGSFYWNLSEEKEGDEQDRSGNVKVDSSGRKVGFELKDVDFRVEKGSLTMIVGKIGSGKSSLIQALLGEMNVGEFEEKTKTARKLKGSVAYLGQKPWIMNATVKENILLGREYDEDFFNKCLRYSALDDDLIQWEKGLEHIVGDKGVALSGGQKARLAFARCLYQDADIYMIDDVTSALDVHVGGMVFNKTIKEFLNNKTVIMTTHNIQFLKDADFIYYMDKGRISAKGAFNDIKDTELFKAFQNQKETLNTKTEEARRLKRAHSVEETPVKGTKIMGKTHQENSSKKIPTLLEKKVSKSKLVEYFLTPEEDLKKQKISHETFIDVLKQVFGKQYIIILTIVLIRASLLNYRDRMLSSWANNFTSLSSMNTFIIYNVISLCPQILGSMVDFMSKRHNESNKGKLSSQMLYRVLHSNLEKFADKIPQSTLKDKIGKSWALGQISDAIGHIIGMAFYSLMLVYNIHSQVGPLFMICIVILTLHTIYGHKRKRKFEADYQIYQPLPERARMNYTPLLAMDLFL